MKKWHSWKSEYASEKFDTIIIGSGMSGLTSGVLLSQYGKRVVAGTFEGNVCAWDVRTLKKVMSKQLGDSIIVAMTFDESGDVE